MPIVSNFELCAVAVAIMQRESEVVLVHTYALG